MMVSFPIEDYWYKMGGCRHELAIWEIHLLCCPILLSCLSDVIMLARGVYHLGLWGCISQGYKIVYYPLILVVTPLAGLFNVEGNVLINQLIVRLDSWAFFLGLCSFLFLFGSGLLQMSVCQC